MGCRLIVSGRGCIFRLGSGYVLELGARHSNTLNLTLPRSLTLTLTHTLTLTYPVPTRNPDLGALMSPQKQRAWRTTMSCSASTVVGPYCASSSAATMSISAGVAGT